MVLLAMEIIYEEEFNVNRQALQLVSSGDARANLVSSQILKSQPVGEQVEYVFQRFFIIFAVIFSAGVKRWFSDAQGQYNLQLMHSFRRSQLTVDPSLDWVSGLAAASALAMAMLPWRRRPRTQGGSASQSGSQSVLPAYA